METLNFKYIPEKMEITDIYGIFHSKFMENTFFLTTHGMFYRINHMTDHKIITDLIRLK